METSLSHVVRAHGMRAFYSKLTFLDPRGVMWICWVMAVGVESTEPQFCHAFLYTDTDPRIIVAGELGAAKKVFRNWIKSYYKDLQVH